MVRIKAKLVDIDGRMSEALKGLDSDKLARLIEKMAVAILVSTYTAVSGKSIQFGLNDRSLKPWQRRVNTVAIPLELALLALYVRELRRHTSRDKGVAERQAFEQEVDRLLRSIAENRPGLQRRL